MFSSGIRCVIRRMVLTEADRWLSVGCGSVRFKCWWCQPWRTLTNQQWYNMTPYTWDRWPSSMFTRQHLTKTLSIHERTTWWQEFTFLCIFTLNLCSSGAPWPYTFKHDPDPPTAPPPFFMHTFISLTADVTAAASLQQFPQFNFWIEC